ALIALPLLSVSVPSLHLPAAGTVLPGDPGLVFQTTVTVTDRNVTAAGVTAPAQGVTPSGAQPRDWRTLMLLLWAAGMVLGGLQTLYAYVSLRRLRRTAIPWPESTATESLARVLMTP